ncbi:MAG: 4Fe-4S binding protein [Nanoarchaeota archaeon]
MKRDIIKIDENKCDGCALCIPNCPEGAIQIIDGKARLISDLFCDGLGACVGHCPKGAIEIEKRNAEPYDEVKTMKNIIPHGENTIRAHLKHLEEHGETKFLEQAINVLRKKGIKIKKKHQGVYTDSQHKNLQACPEPNMSERKSSEEIFTEGKKESHKQTPCNCPSMQMQDFTKKKKSSSKTKIDSELQQWPVQLSLLTPYATFFDNADLLVCADCVPFAYANFHQELLRNKKLVIGCPKLDDVQEYEEKLTEIFKSNNVKSVTIAIMEVPCCGGLLSAVENALQNSGKKIPLIMKTIKIGGIE